MPFKIFLPFLLLCILPGFTAFAAPDTVSVYFPFNKNMLSEAARQQLDAAIYKGAISEKQPIQIIGYTDAVGGDTYNLRLSKQRALSVKTYLIQSGFNAGNITLITGKGKAGAHAVSGPDGNPADRRVDIVKGNALPQPESAKPVASKNIPRSEPRKISATDIGTVAAGDVLLLDKIYFYPGRHYFREESNEALEALYEALVDHPKIRISIEGHVCCMPANVSDAQDDDTHRPELSVNRALAVRNYLIRKGIAANRLEYAGFGRRRPVVEVEHSEEEADKNRRVEIRVIK